MNTRANDKYRQIIPYFILYIIQINSYSLFYNLREKKIFKYLYLYYEYEWKHHEILFFSKILILFSIFLHYCYSIDIRYRSWKFMKISRAFHRVYTAFNCVSLNGVKWKAIRKGGVEYRSLPTYFTRVAARNIRNERTKERKRESKFFDNSYAAS